MQKASGLRGMIYKTLKVFKTFRVCVPGEVIKPGDDTGRMREGREEDMGEGQRREGKG